MLTLAVQQRTALLTRKALFTVYCTSSLTICCLAAFFIGLMPQEIALTPAHLVRDASNFNNFSLTDHTK